MQPQDTRTTNEELARVTSEYSQRFGHPPGDKLPSTKFGRASQADILQLAKAALENDEPVQTWATAHEAQKAMEKTGWAVVK